MQCLRNKKIIKIYENFCFKNHNTGKDSLHTATSTVPLFLFFFLCSIKIKKNVDNNLLFHDQIAHRGSI